MVPRVSVLITKEADFSEKEEINGYCIQKGECSNYEALAKLKQKDHFESTNQQKLKGRYSIVVFDHYGKITLDNSQLLIKLDNHCEIVKNQPYQRLKEFVDKYYFEIKDKYLKDLPFISGFIGHVALI